MPLKFDAECERHVKTQQRLQEALQQTKFAVQLKDKALSDLETVRNKLNKEIEELWLQSQSFFRDLIIPCISVILYKLFPFFEPPSIMGPEDLDLLEIFHLQCYTGYPPP